MSNISDSDSRRTSHPECLRASKVVLDAVLGDALTAGETPSLETAVAQARGEGTEEMGEFHKYITPEASPAKSCLE